MIGRPCDAMEGSSSFYQRDSAFGQMISQHHGKGSMEAVNLALIVPRTIVFGWFNEYIQHFRASAQSRIMFNLRRKEEILHNE